MTPATRRALARCLIEQRRCRRYLRSGGPDAAGAWMGLTDWAMEEVILRQEQATWTKLTTTTKHASR